MPPAPGHQGDGACQQNSERKPSPAKITLLDAYYCSHLQNETAQLKPRLGGILERGWLRISPALGSSQPFRPYKAVSEDK